MESNIGLGPRTRLLPIADCETIVAEIKERSAHLTSEVEAAEAARMLLGMYPARHVHDADTYSKAITTVFMASQPDFVKRVVDPVRGIPSKLKYLPTVAEISEALHAENVRRFTIWRTAEWMIREHERRTAEAQERARWSSLGEAELERRRAQVAALLGSKGPGTGDWTGEGEP